MNRSVRIPVGERADKRVDQQLDESFGGEQQTNTNVFLLQENTVLKTRRLLQDGRRNNEERRENRIERMDKR